VYLHDPTLTEFRLGLLYAAVRTGVPCVPQCFPAFAWAHPNCSECTGDMAIGCVW